MLFKVNCKGLVNKLSSFLSFKINRLAKKFVPNEIKKVNKINNLAARGLPPGAQGPRRQNFDNGVSRRQKNDNPILRVLFPS